MIRRTITVDDALNRGIQKIRGQLTERDMEVDYTTMINLFATLGFLRLGDMDNWTPLETSVFNYIIGNEQLKLEAAIDHMQDLYVKLIPKIAQSVLEAKKAPTSV